MKMKSGHFVRRKFHFGLSCQNWTPNWPHIFCSLFRFLCCLSFWKAERVYRKLSHHSRITPASLPRQKHLCRLKRLKRNCHHSVTAANLTEFGRNKNLQSFLLALSPSLRTLLKLIGHLQGFLIEILAWTSKNSFNFSKLLQSLNFRV